MFSQPVRTVGPAVFSRLQHDRGAMRRTFLSAAALLRAAALPVCLLIGGSARPLIGFVYGARWLPAAQPLMWLALLGAVQVFFLLGYDFLVVLAQSRFLLITQLVWLLTLVPALVVGPGRTVSTAPALPSSRSRGAAFSRGTWWNSAKQASGSALSADISGSRWPGLRW